MGAVGLTLDFIAVPVDVAGSDVREGGGGSASFCVGKKGRYEKRADMRYEI